MTTITDLSAIINHVFTSQLSQICPCINTGIDIACYIIIHQLKIPKSLRSGCGLVRLLGNEYTGSTHFLDLSFGSSTEKFCLDDDWLLGKMALTKNLVVALCREREGEGERETEREGDVERNKSEHNH